MTTQSPNMEPVTVADAYARRLIEGRGTLYVQISGALREVTRIQHTGIKYYCELLDDAYLEIERNGNDILDYTPAPAPTPDPQAEIAALRAERDAGAT